MPLGNPLVRGSPGYPCVLFPLALPWRLPMDGAGRRGRRPLQGIAGIRQMSGQIGPPPQRHSAAPAAPFIPRRGGCPHPPVSSPHPPPDKAQTHSEGRAFRHPPRGLRQSDNRGARPAQLSGPARAGRRLPGFRQHKFRTTPVFKQTCAHAQVLRQAIFSLGPSTARSLFVKNKKRMGGGLPD